MKQIGVGGFKPNSLGIKYVNEILKSGRLSYGDYHRRFESQFAELHGCAHGIFCNSGTSALQIALQALKEANGWADGDEVLVPAVTFIATSNIVLHNRLTPVFVDVDPKTYNIDHRQIERKIGKNTRAIIPVHLMGLPASMGPIMAIARRNGLKVVEDACEAILARFRGHPVGSFGDISCFSTYIAHYVVTGIGGMATTNDPDLAVRMRSLMNHGRDSIYLNIDDNLTKSAELIAGRFNFVTTGHSFRATEMEAALGLSQLPGIRKVMAQRQERAARLTDILRDVRDYVQVPTIPKDREHSFMLYPIVTKHGGKRELVEHLENNGIETRDLLPLISQPIYKRMFGDLSSQFPVANFLNRNGFYVGCHQYLSLKDMEFIGNAIKKFYGA